MIDFYGFEDEIPYVTEGKKHSVKTYFGDDVRTGSPGKYVEKTNGGDFVVDTLIDDKWVPLRHDDFFTIVAQMTQQDPEYMRNKFAPALIMLSKGKMAFEDIDKIPGGPYVRQVTIRTLLRTLMLIMVAEFRRFAKFEPLGGRNLVIRFILGIIYEVWPASEAVGNVKSGAKGLRMMRHRYTNEPSFKEVLQG